ncbi:hypothetical protein AMECASPLE_021140 [Ameca splendens]|uniref:Uncharacterized protein n=1 Tax=Ameca splendens TaxID=208324 RepID=A0ABV1AAP0_9TELE
MVTKQLLCSLLSAELLILDVTSPRRIPVCHLIQKQLMATEMDQQRKKLQQREQDSVSLLCSFFQSYFPVIQLNAVLPLCFSR